MKFSIIVAVDKNRGIGKDNALPWRLKQEMKYFKEMTTGNVVIMGRNTWESIPEKYRPLPDRLNVILSKTLTQKDAKVTITSLDKAIIMSSLDEALDFLAIAKGLELPEASELFIIGGAQLYNDAIKHKGCERLYITEIDQDFDCDTFFPQYDDFKPIKDDVENEEDGIKYKFRLLEKV